MWHAIVGHCLAGLYAVSLAIELAFVTLIIISNSVIKAVVYIS